MFNEKNVEQDFYPFGITYIINWAFCNMSLIKQFYSYLAIGSTVIITCVA